jgi:glutaredoxin
MKKSKIMIFCLLVFSIICLIIYVILALCVSCPIVETIVLGLLTSAVVTLFVSVLDYCCFRDEEIQKFKLEISKYFCYLMDFKKDINDILVMFDKRQHIKVEDYVKSNINTLKYLCVGKPQFLSFDFILKDKNFTKTTNYLYDLTFGTKLNEIYNKKKIITLEGYKSYLNDLLKEINKEVDTINNEMKNIKKFKIAKEWEKFTERENVFGS